MLQEEVRPSKNGLLYWGMLDGGVIFKGSGNYGSTKYDPFDDYEFLEVYICDTCLVNFSERIKHFKRIGKRKNNYKYTGTFKDYEDRV